MAMPRRTGTPRREMNSFILRHVRPGSAIVDVGCGRGETALLIARHAPDVRIEGIERDRARAAAANRRFRRAGRERTLRCRPGDATELRRTFGRARFDFAIANNSFHEFWHPVRALRAIRAVLKPEGTLLIVEFVPKAGELVDDCPRYSRRKIIELTGRGGFRRASSAERSDAILVKAQKG